MGEFPIYTTQRSLPGVSGGVTANLNPRTGGEAVGEAMMGFGRQATEFGVDMYVAQGRAELAESFAADKEEINKLMIDLESEDDPEAYRQRFEEAWSGIESREVKNGYARQRRAEVLPGFKVNVGAIIHEQAKRRIDQNADAALDSAAADAIQTGRMTNYRIMLEAEAQRRGWSKEVQQAMVQDVAYKVSQQRIAADTGNDPESFLKQNPNPAAFQKNYPHSKPTDWQWARGMAEAAAADRRREEDALTHQQLEGIYGSARTQGIEAVRQKIAQSDGLTEAQKVQAMKVAIAASELWGKTGVNPWENTTDYASLAQAMIDVRSKGVKSLAEINQRMFEGNKPNWSFSDWQRVTGLYVSLNKPTKEAGGYSRSHPVAAMYFDRLTAEYTDKKGKIGKPEEFTTKYMLLEKAFMDPEVWRNADKMEAAYDGLMKEERDRKARSWVSTLLPFPAFDYWVRPTPATGQPTPEELRRQNTRAAYEKGKELGYWQ